MSNNSIAGVRGDTEMTLVVKLPSSSDLFKKHFNDMGSVGFHHPNMEAFFNDLNDVCKIEDSIKQINQLYNGK